MDFLTQEEILEFWKVYSILEKLETKNKNGEKFTFYDGPPFASGNPHYGHLLAGTIKDIIVRYQNLSGKHVPCKWGWDTHGVPVESKTNKELNIQTKDDVLKMGVGEYNKKCREYVMSCEEKWKRVTEKLGRWIDMENAYKTMDPEFMQTIWYMFKQLYHKQLIYYGVKIMPYSPELGCPLSNNEANLNYKEISDPSLTIELQSEINESFLGGNYHASDKIYFLVWTTTPWSLPCNLLVCVHPELDYVLLKRKSDGKVYVLLEKQVKKYFKKESHDILYKIKGKDLVGLKYSPLFPFYTKFQSANPAIEPFCVVADTMVSADSGTGIVHIAPGFGQDDINVCNKYGLISKEILPPCPLDDSCKYISPVGDWPMFKDKFCKDSDQDVIKYLKAEGKVFHVGTIVHSYPYCYRTDKPLIYRTYPAWFIKVLVHKDKIKANLMKTNWVPNFIKDHKYAQSLECVVDWCISRNRFWGTPMPIWTNEDDEIIVVESTAELEKLAGLPSGSIIDLHPEFIWDIVIPSQKPGGKPLKNVRLVFDCWFESGSMPFAQHGYPFNTEAKLEDIFPADFIAEGTDQTRGWFHALMTLYTLIVGEAPFKNVIVNGIVQSQVPDPQKPDKMKWAKMSKKDGNFDDPEKVIDTFGADTLRLFFTKSPGVRAGDVPFDTKQFNTIYKNYHIMTQNMVEFWKQSLDIYYDKYKQLCPIIPLTDLADKDVSLIDVWIIQEVNQFIQNMCNDLSNYQLFYLSNYIDTMIDRLSRWYIKLNKKPLKGEADQKSFEVSITVLTHVLHYMLLMMAPITPFMSESFYLFMKKQVGVLITENALHHPESIHLHQITPKLEFGFKEVDGLLDGMSLFVKIIDMTRQFRADHKIFQALKMPIKKMFIVYPTGHSLTQLQQLTYYLKQEVNVDELVYMNNPHTFLNIKYTPDLKKIGQEFKKDAKGILAYLSTMEITDYTFDHLSVLEFTMSSGIKVSLDKSYFIESTEIKEYNKTKQVVMNSDKLVAVFDLDTNDDMFARFYLNCIYREVQQMRKENNLKPIDNVKVTYTLNDNLNMKLYMRLQCYQKYINDALKTEISEYQHDNDSEPFISNQRNIANVENLTINFHKV